MFEPYTYNHIAVVSIRVETHKFMLALTVRVKFDLWLRKLTLEPHAWPRYNRCIGAFYQPWNTDQISQKKLKEEFVIQPSNSRQRELHF